MSDRSWWHRQTTARRDAVLLGLVGIAVYAIAGLLELGELLSAFAERYERYQIDELFLAVKITAVGGLAYALRRWREHRSEVERRRQVEDALQREIDARDELMAVVSHEIRNPPSSVAGLTSYLADSLPQLQPDEAEDTLRLVSREAYDAASIIEDLLVSARSRLDTVGLSIVPVDISAEVDQVLAAVSPREVEVTWNPTTAWVAADPARLRQIIRNLLTNAIRYGGRGLVIRVSRDLEHVVLHVSDDGPGVSANLVDSLFQPFARLSPETARHPYSTGLGLSVSRDLARRMDGDLSYHRTSDETNFRLRLPAASGPSQLSIS